MKERKARYRRFARTTKRRLNYVSCFLAIVVAMVSCGLATQPAAAREMMTDRCSSEVAFPPAYDAPLAGPGTVVLKRGANGWSNWIPMHVRTDGSGHIRWWCHSTTGNWFDVGTWRVINLQFGAECSFNDSGQVSNCKWGDQDIKLGSSAWQGWTPERSRCGDHSTSIAARLGPDRLLNIACLGH